MVLGQLNQCFSLSGCWVIRCLSVFLIQQGIYSCLRAELHCFLVLPQRVIFGRLLKTDEVSKRAKNFVMSCTKLATSQKKSNHDFHFLILTPEIVRKCNPECPITPATYLVVSTTHTCFILILLVDASIGCHDSAFMFGAQNTCINKIYCEL